MPRPETLPEARITQQREWQHHRISLEGRTGVAEQFITWQTEHGGTGLGDQGNAVDPFLYPPLPR